VIEIICLAGAAGHLVLARKSHCIAQVGASDGRPVKIHIARRRVLLERGWCRVAGVERSEPHWHQVKRLITCYHGGAVMVTRRVSFEVAHFRVIVWPKAIFTVAWATALVVRHILSRNATAGNSLGRKSQGL
jgi:hypothetical protein